MVDKDTKGEKGEALVSLLLASIDVNFRVQLIGGKWPTIDIYAEVDDTAYPGMFCFIQVKSTTLPRLANGNLPVQLTKAGINKLCSYYGPTYLVGVEYDEQLPQLSNAFIMSVQGSNLAGIASMSTANQLNQRTGATLLALRDDIISFWNSTNVPAKKLIFKSSL